MNDAVDRADNEVQGLARYFPTTLSKSLVVATVGVPIAVFQIVRGNVDWFLLQGRTPLEQTLVAATAALCISVLLFLVLAFELASIISARKHRHIVHYTNEHPCMSFRWLAANAKFLHWLALFFLLIVAFFLGCYAAGI